jgi:hypothetical protein
VIRFALAFYLASVAYMVWRGVIGRREYRDAIEEMTADLRTVFEDRPVMILTYALYLLIVVVFSPFFMLEHMIDVIRGTTPRDGGHDS